ncbi:MULTISPECIES: Hint domain-containing protein [Pacificibacter]|uniref:Hint domain-containing protein n=1 Tax=Pacificibacter TaxID=1042323 RepID=UPI001C0A275A|nr:MULTISPECIES: Hint domain-containing protein [Pacificibacter]MBU2935911.1 Hint domain-containing protein [Pacificibacter marinus]MDO6614406.1 Hint domain-containing protein [Pacificibacter sp. 1_MG-2023]
MMKLGQLFAKDRTADIFGRSSTWDGSLSGSNVQANGFCAGTKLATNLGWRNVESLRLGDLVLTFDDGVQKITRIDRTVITDHQLGQALQDWPLHIPKGALGNHDEMTLMPEQAVMIESDLGEAMFGDPFTLVPACALIGYKGIERIKPRGAIDVISIHFDSEQIVFANVGALFHCLPAEGDLVADLANESAALGYDVLSMAQATDFVTAMRTDANQDAAWMNDTRLPTAIHAV